MTILVTGATGHVGRHIVEQLAARGGPVRALTRTDHTAEPPEAVQVFMGDLTRPATVESALAGAQTLHLVPETAVEIVELARRSGVRRIVVLSCGSAGHGDQHHLTVERAVENAGLQRTHLRPYGLMSNALLWAGSVRTESVVRAPHGQFTYPHVHEADVATVAVDALLDDRRAGAA